MSCNDIAIRVEGLGKFYRIGRQPTRADTRLGRLWRASMAPFAWARSQFRSPTEAECLWALRDVSFEVKRGEVLGIIGGNGAGKSTLLKILSRITDPTEGYADIFGRVGSLLEVGTGMHPELTGRENIFVNGCVLGMRKSEVRKKFDEIVDFAGVSRFLDTPVKRYSSGMHVRLGFAIAAHLEPEILLVDEVLAVGDAEFQRKCLGRMGEVAVAGRTVIFVSHNMAAVTGLCTRAILLESGHITKAGATREIVEQYLQGLQHSFNTNPLLTTSPDGSVQLVGVAFLNKQGVPVDSVMCGQDVSVRLHVRAHQETPHLIVSIGIDDAHGIRVALLANTLVSKELALQNGDLYISCIVPELPLTVGTYTLSVKISTQLGVLIWCPNAIPLNVQTGDFFRSGKMIDASWMGSSLIRHEWSVAQP